MGGSDAGDPVRARVAMDESMPEKFKRPAEWTQSGWAAGTTSGDGGSRVAMSDEMRGSDAAAPGGGGTGDDYTSAMDSSDGAARARKRRREAVDASGAMDETMGGDDEDGGGDEDGDGGEELSLIHISEPTRPC